MTAETIPFPVTHSIDLAHEEIQEHWKHIMDSVGRLPGVLSVTHDQESDSLSLTYDVKKIHLQDIEDFIHQQGYHLKDGLLAHLHRDFAHFTEKNESDASHAKPRDFHSPSFH